jgi:hypothetical protein
VLSGTRLPVEFGSFVRASFLSRGLLTGLLSFNFLMILKLIFSFLNCAAILYK